MLDAHAPQKPIEDWKDFLYHIFFVAIGLLLAISLEQFVIYVNHRIQVAETRSALAKEREINIRHFAIQSEENDRVIPILQKNLEVLNFLHLHPGAPKSQWPGELRWGGLYPDYDDAAWQTASTGPVFQYMPPVEVRRLNFIYTKLHELNAESEAELKLKYQVYSTFSGQTDAATLSPQSVDKQLALCSELLEAYAFASRTQHTINRFNPDFAPVPKFTANNIFGNLGVTPDERKVITDERTRMYEKDNLNSNTPEQ
jgi:hypothetical protein